MLAIAKSRKIGLDIERLEKRRIVPSVLSRFFHADEVQAILDAPPELQGARFHQYWTLKESYVKALGSTLADGMLQIHFGFSVDAKSIRPFLLGMHSEASAWQFWLFQRSNTHVLSLCAQRIESRQTAFVIREVTPLERERFSQWQALRESS